MSDHPTPAPARTEGEGSTRALVGLIESLRWPELDLEVRHAARRHLLDTVGVMISGCAGDVVRRLAAALPTVGAQGPVPIPASGSRAGVLDMAQLGGTGAHGIELDDGYRQGSVHPGVAVVPAALAAAYGRGVPGTALIEAVVAGYETVAGIARVAHPELRRRGFHATGTVGVFGAAAASARILGLDAALISNALGLAGSRSAGLFAFLRGGADVKRLHAGHAARDGLFSAQLALAGIAGPPDILEGSDGFLQAFAFGDSPAPRVLSLPPDVEFAITDCYVKPYACCRHLQPAVEAMMDLRAAHGLAEDDVQSIEVETYGIAAKHADTDWNSFATAQLSFPFIMALGLRYGEIDLVHFADEVRGDPGIARICDKVRIRTAPDLDRLYPDLRPARVTLETRGGRLVKEAHEALGSRIVPLDDSRLERKFLNLCTPVIGARAAADLAARLWRIEDCPDVSAILDACALRDPG